MHSVWLLICLELCMVHIYFYLNVSTNIRNKKGKVNSLLFFIPV